MLQMNLSNLIESHTMITSEELNMIHRREEESRRPSA